MKYLSTRILFLIMLTCSCVRFSYAQQSVLDSLFAKGDSTAVIDSLLKDFDSYLDSLTKPRSFFSASVGIGNGYYSFENKNSVFLTNAQKMMISPSVGYYHKSGLGITATGYYLLDDANSQFYQFSITPSYDFIGHKKIGFGFAFSRYFEKDSLPFYKPLSAMNCSDILPSRKCGCVPLYP